MRAFLSAVWKYVKAFFAAVGRLFLRYPLAAALTVILVAVAAAALVSGKTLQIGGLLGRLWGTKKPERARGVPPEDRKDDQGKPIQPGESDDKGWVQAPVTSIVEPGIFSDPSEVEVDHPEKGRVVIELPRGVENKDVREVVEIGTNVYEVRNRDKGVKPGEIDDVLKKLGD